VQSDQNDGEDVYLYMYSSTTGYSYYKTKIGAS